MVVALYTIIFALLASLVAKIGVIISIIHEKKPFHYSARIVRSLAAGLILGTVFLFLWPVANVSSKAQGVWSLLGLITFLALDTYISFFDSNSLKISPGDKNKKRKANASIIFGGHIIRFFIYGVLLSIGFRIGRWEGVIIAGGIVLHQYPEAMANFAVLKDNWSLRRAIIATFLSPFIILLGAAISFVFILSSFCSVLFLDIASAIIIGILVYLGLSDLIQRPDLGLATISFGTLGAVTVFLLRMFIL